MDSLGSRITDEALAALRQRLGMEHPIPSPYNTEVSRDAIRQHSPAPAGMSRHTAPR